MVVVRRQIVAQVTIGTTTVTDFLGLRVSNSLEQSIARAQIICPVPHGTYNDQVTIQCGAIPGNGLATRFVGYRRKANYELYPRLCTIECIGRLGLAAEYTNWQDGLANQVAFDPNSNAMLEIGQGGLRVQDLVPTSTHYGGCATFAEIAAAVLTKVGVPYVGTNLHSSGRLYGGGLDSGWRFIWHSGTLSLNPLQGNSPQLINAFQRAGDTALAYLQKYSQIDCFYDAGPPEVAGFYRLYEGIDGTVHISLIGGRPRGTPTCTFTEGGSAFIQNTEGVQFDPADGTVNILTASIARDYPLGNRTLVIGSDLGGYQCRYEAVSENPFMTPGSTTYHYDPSPPGSDWIDWQNYNSAPMGYLTSGGLFGMDCETVAKARLPEINRETVSGTLTTAEDYLIQPGDVHLVQGPAGIPDRLGTGELLWVQGIDFDLENRNGAPVLTQTPTYLGGGAP
jgi:hypothetical protein